MFAAILKGLGLLLGFQKGATVLNTAGGMANYALLIAGAKYALTHSDQQIPLGTVSLSALALIGVLLFVIAELLRRRMPGAGGPPQE